MSEGSGQSLDANAEVRNALRAAVAKRGPGILSDPELLEGSCDDKWVDYPNEASLALTAAKADVAAMIRQQAEAVGPDEAVRLTASTLAGSRSLDPNASLWIVSEFARALDYEVSDTLAPASTAGDLVPDKGPGVKLGDESETQLPPAPEDNAESSAEPSPSPKPRRPRRMLLGGAIAVVVVAAVVVVLVVVVLPGTSPYTTLSKLIPSGVSGGAPGSSGSNCTKHKPLGGAVAEYECTTSNLPATFIAYVLFPNSGSLGSAYQALVTNAANTVDDSGKDCGNFNSYTPPCETKWSGKHPKVQGRIVEYNYEKSPWLTFTVENKLLLVAMAGSGSKGSGDGLFNWWAGTNSFPWLNS